MSVFDLQQYPEGMLNLTRLLFLDALILHALETKHFDAALIPSRLPETDLDVRAAIQLLAAHYNGIGATFHEGDVHAKVLCFSDEFRLQAKLFFVKKHPLNLAKHEKLVKLFQETRIGSPKRSRHETQLVAQGEYESRTAAKIGRVKTTRRSEAKSQSKSRKAQGSNRVRQTSKSKAKGKREPGKAELAAEASSSSAAQPKGEEAQGAGLPEFQRRSGQGGAS